MSKTIKKNSICNKATATIFAVLILSVLIIGTMPNASATIVEINTFSHVMLAPNPVGVGQAVLVTLQEDKVAPGTTSLTNLFNGTTLTVTKPDGTNETLGPYQLYATASTTISYVPSQVGVYHFQMNFAEQWVNASGIERHYKSSISPIGEGNLTVQQDPVPSLPYNPLPTDYWTRPVYAENKGWGQISNNWLMAGYDDTSRIFHWRPVYAKNATGPETPHVMWTKPMWFGGIIGGEFGDETYYTGLSYEQPYYPLILNGRIIYTEHSSTNTNIYDTKCVSLYTGEDIWVLNNTNIAFAQTLIYDSPNAHGGLAYLWSTTGRSSQLVTGSSVLTATGDDWVMYDAFTGRQILTLTNMTGLTGTSYTGQQTTYDEKGNIISYTTGGNSTYRWLSMWNSTLAILEPGYAGTSNAPVVVWNPTDGSVIDGKRGIQWNVSIPLTASNTVVKYIDKENNMLITLGLDNNVYPQVFMTTGFDLSAMKPDTTGKYPTQLNYKWTKNFTNIENLITSGAFIDLNSRNVDGGVFVQFDDATLKLHAYSSLTGDELWVSEPLTGWAFYTGNFIVAYGMVYGAGYDGHVYAWNATNGNIVWDYFSGTTDETAYGSYPVYNGFTIANHKIYIANDEHSPDSVLWRGGKLYCIDADTGNSLWNISGWLRQPAVADGYLTAVNALDNQIYTLGKGPSKTTVSAPQTEIIQGQKIMITGTVTDQTPVSKDTPAISDESMGAWMSYVHQQQPFPTNATGVTVNLSVIDANNNYRIIGSTTSSTSGTFKLSWAPDIPGDYTIIATFPGSNAYGSSYAETAIVVTEPSATQQPTPTPQSAADLYFVPAIAGLFVLVIVVLALLVVMMMKKRP